jgi:hypothetical protein
VEATQAEKRAGCVLVKFDDRVFWKTYLELLNLGLSKLNHSSVTLWSADVPDERAALAMLESPGGYWVHHFPVSEIDYVWRLVVNSHLQSKAFGGVVNLKAHSFESQSGGEVEIRALVRDPRELVELKRVGTGVLSVAPGRGDTKTAIFFVSEKMALKAEKAARESKARLEEKSTYKLQKEKSKASEKKEGRPFHTEIERNITQLYKVETSSPITWVKVDP